MCTMSKQAWDGRRTMNSANMAERRRPAEKSTKENNRLNKSKLPKLPAVVKKKVTAYQGLTLVHFSAELKRFPCDKGCI